MDGCGRVEGIDIGEEEWLCEWVDEARGVLVREYGHWDFGGERMCGEEDWWAVDL